MWVSGREQVDFRTVWADVRNHSHSSQPALSSWVNRAAVAYQWQRQGHHTSPQYFSLIPQQNLWPKNMLPKGFHSWPQWPRIRTNSTPGLSAGADLASSCGMRSKCWNEENGQVAQKFPCLLRNAARFKDEPLGSSTWHAFSCLGSAWRVGLRVPDPADFLISSISPTCTFISSFKFSLWNDAADK
jgi:hypothetical protein